MKGTPDVRKGLPLIYDEWDNCTDCDLGPLRVLRGGRIVFGEGDPKPDGVMFVSGDISRDDEREDRIVGAAAGKLLHKLIANVRLNNYYITSLTACRSCTPMLDDQGLPLLSKGFRGKPQEPKYKDQPATKPQILACSRRLHDEIYTVDPLIIVALGQSAAAALRGRPFNMLKDRGYPEEIDIPGAGHLAVVSGKRREWLRKVKGQLSRPVKQATVRYLMYPTLHPLDVQNSIMNEGKDNPYSQLASDIYKVAKIWNSFHEELYGKLPNMVGVEEVPQDIADEIRDEEEDERLNGD